MQQYGISSARPIAAAALAGWVMVCQAAANPTAVSQSGNEWPWYHGNAHGTHYSTLDQINTGNVKDLKVAWTFDSGDAFGDGGNQSDMQGNPLVVGDRFYFVSPKGRLFCLNAATGEQRWVFDPAFGEDIRTKQRLRGVSYWRNGGEERIFVTFRGHLMAVDARTGKLAAGFGKHGKIDMREGLGRDPDSVSVGNVSPGVVYKNLIVMGSTGNTPGHIRAYDVRTGAQKWIFHTIPHPGEKGYDTWPKDAWKTAMGANAWSGLTLDPERGIVFAPLGSAGMGNKDFYGGDRIGDNLFGTSLVALDANTGKRRWHFQLVRHDLWDRDPPTPPTLITVNRNGKRIPALVQPTKAGVIYILDRLTGQPMYPLTELRPPASDIPGEVSAPTQALPTLPKPFARQQLTADMLTKRTAKAHHDALAAFSGLHSRGPFDPPSQQGTVLFPGMDGGAEWGGAAYDPTTGIIYVNANEMAWVLKVKQHPPVVAGKSGQALYLNTCAACHGNEGKGSPPEFPALAGVHDRLTPAQLRRQIAQGGGRMPGFGGTLSDADVDAIIGYLRGDPAQMAPKGAPAYPSTEGDSWVFDGYTKFLDAEGYPAITPPWGTLSAINVNTGEYVWTQPFGEYPELAAQGMTDTGSENYGGAVVTRGGLLLIGATVYDNRFRAFDKNTGKLLWQTTLPAAGIATPATYAVSGKQYVAIGAGGGKNVKSKPGGSIVVFSLP
ncbi:outer membrane protein assembly factor BamB family protein [Duganella sp. PWIR1]